MEKLNNPTQEDWFWMWVDELVEAGYIDSIKKHPDVPTFELFKGMKKDYTVPNKTNTKLITKQHTLMRPVSYTPDGIIQWNKKAEGIFYFPLDYAQGDWLTCYFTPQKHPTEDFYYSIVEVKGPTGNQKAYGSDFKFTQKWLWANTGQFVQKVMLAPAKLFKTEKSHLPYLWSMTFTPKRFYYTDKLSVNKSKPVPYRTQPNKKGVPLYKMRTLEEFLVKYK